MGALELAPIEQEPFPHVHIDGIFPNDFYWKLIRHINESVEFKKTTYPGTSVDLSAEGFKDHGLIASEDKSDDLLNSVYAFLKSEQFSRALLDKFSAPNSRIPYDTAIPKEKHAHFQDNDNYTSTLKLHIDLPGYEIPPHPDTPEKIITFMFYFAQDESLAKYGTHLCKAKPGIKPRKSTIKPIERFLSKFSGQYGLAQRQSWYQWEDFDISGTARALPNTFLSFAPNEISFHGVRLNVPGNLKTKGRMVIRGFIRSGRNTPTRVTRYEHKLARRAALLIARLFNRPHH